MWSIIPCFRGAAQSSQQPSTIFPRAAGKSLKSGAITSEQRAEYVQLVARELKCGKLRLQQDAQGVGSVFAVGKSGGRQRKIWNGSGLSELAAVPPKPHRLANPSSFLDVDLSPGEKIVFSKRDAATFFDVLQVPEPLQSWFGQPPVQVKELIAAGLSPQEVQCFSGQVSCAENLVLYPVHAVWPMGFSWSSAIAQSTTVATCLSAGIKESSILSPDHDLPETFEEACLVATDDTVLLHKCKRKGHDTLRRLDEAFERHGIPRNKAKDVSLAEHVTALGCDLTSEPPLVQPAEAKLCSAVRRTMDLLHHGKASPRGLHALLGVWEWFALLQRGLFSIYDSVFAFVRRLPEKAAVDIPCNVANEMLMALLLAPFLAVRLDRQPLHTLVATDAAPEFGFGVSACGCDRHIAASVCKLAERRGDYVRLTPGPGDAPEVDRLGNPKRLPHTQLEFKTIISAKARWSAHSSVLEAHGYLLGLKWLARHAAKHHHKVPFLVDAKAVIGAATKGRSSARALRTVLRSSAAHCLACDILPRLVYIPSESNPADQPSRGCKNKPSRRPQRVTSGKSRALVRLERILQNWTRAAEIMQRWM